MSADRVEKFKRDRNILFSFETSAKTGENIENLFIFASKILYHNNKDKIAQMVSKFIHNFVEIPNLYEISYSTRSFLIVIFRFIRKRKP